jgi:hypothetical protein
MSQHTEQRAHLDLQINLLSEGENTKRLQMHEALCASGLAIAPDRELEKSDGQINAAEVVVEIKKHTVDPARDGR